LFKDNLTFIINGTRFTNKRPNKRNCEEKWNQYKKCLKPQLVNFLTENNLAEYLKSNQNK